jgi:hypothetical protein
MQNSHKFQLRIAPHRAILHRKESFVTEPEWLIVSSSRLQVSSAQSPSHSQRQVRELRSYFYLHPSPILTPISQSYHTASSISLAISCSCALRSRYCNLFFTALLDGTTSAQHRSTRPLPHSELTAHIECCVRAHHSLTVTLFLSAQKKHHHTFNLASLRKTHTMPNENAITRLLYAILSQKCLKDVSHTLYLLPRPLFPPLPSSSTIFATSPNPQPPPFSSTHFSLLATPTNHLPSSLRHSQLTRGTDRLEQSSV